MVHLPVVIATLANAQAKYLPVLDAMTQEKWLTLFDSAPLYNHPIPDHIDLSSSGRYLLLPYWTPFH